jgi:hypothetical protein
VERTDSPYTEIGMSNNNGKEGSRIYKDLDINFISIFSDFSKEPVQLELPLVKCTTGDNNITNVIPLIKKGVTNVKN